MGIEIEDECEETVEEERLLCKLEKLGRLIIEAFEGRRMPSVLVMRCRKLGLLLPDTLSPLSCIVAPSLPSGIDVADADDERSPLSGRRNESKRNIAVYQRQRMVKAFIDVTPTGLSSSKFRRTKGAMIYTINR